MRNSSIFSLIAGIAGCFVSLASFAATLPSSQLPAHEQAIANLILGEMAIQQNQIGEANSYYLAAAELSHDPNVIKQIVYLALMSNNIDIALNAAKQWATLAPKDIEAQLITFDLLLKTQQTATAVPYLQQALKIGNKNVTNSVIAELQDTPQALQQTLLVSIMELPKPQQSEPNLQLITSLLQFQTGNQQQAITTINSILLQHPDWPQAIALKADYLVNINQMTQALEFTAAKAKQYPKQPMIQLIEAEMLLKAKQEEAAINKLQALKAFPETHGIALLTLAQLALQKKDITNGTIYLKEATSDPDQASNAYYLLGEVYQFEHKTSEAIQAYQQVQDGQYYLTAQLKAATLLANNNQNQQALDALSNIKIDNMNQAKQVILLQAQLLMKMKQTPVALQVLNKAIVAIPNDIELLYARSVIANSLDDSAQSEKDLKQILKIDPNQVTALNALGYLLISTPARYQEALTYTQRALTLAPQNPSILDTMGWLQYHMGNYQSAYQYLSRAYQLDYDGIIAAHYGEVLWRIGNKPAAKEVWQAALVKFPNDPDLLDTIKRFNP